MNTKRHILFIAACAGITAFGFVLAILGTLFGMPEMRERLNITLAQQGNILLLLYLGIFISSLVVGPLIDRAGNKPILSISSVLVFLASILFARAHSMTLADLAVVLLGMGGGGLNTCTNALVSDVYGSNRGPMLNLLGIFFGIGALSIPLLAASIQGHFTVVEVLITCALLPGLCAIAYASLRFPPPAEGRSVGWKQILEVAKQGGVWLIGLLLFFESGNEASIGGWTSTYASTCGFSSRAATLVLSGYWAALMLSRVLAGSLLRVMTKAQLVLAAALLSLIACGVLLSARSLLWLSFGAALIGLSSGPIFPTVLGIAGDRYSRMAGTVFGLLFSIALVGGMTLPWAIGQVSQRSSVRNGMIVPLLGAAGICCVSATLIRQSRSEIVSKIDSAVS